MLVAGKIYFPGNGSLPASYLILSGDTREVKMTLNASPHPERAPSVYPSYPMYFYVEVLERPRSVGAGDKGAKGREHL